MARLKRPLLEWAQAAAAVMVLLAAAYFIFRPILFLNNPLDLPWGSDTLGHLARTEFLARSIQQGDSVPQIDPNWYLGIQTFRYYSPVPYYLIDSLSQLTRSLPSALNVCIVLAFFVGSLCLLLYRRWLGMPLSTAAAVLYLLLPDMLRVAFSEGNLPRVFAFALLPLYLYLLLRILERDSSRWHEAGLALTLAAVVLCHAMMGAIYAVFGGLLLIGAVVLGLISWRKGLTGIIVLVVGIAITGWWLLPSLTGGITNLNAQAVAQGLDHQRLVDLFNPLRRLQNLEVDYASLAVATLAIVFLFIKSTRSKMTVLLTSVGLLGTLIMTNGIFDLAVAIPGMSLLWPARFLGVASLLLLLSVLFSLRKLGARLTWLAGLGVVIILLDFLPSTRLIFLRPVNTDLQVAAAGMADSSGWREATLDESRLGSTATYLIGKTGAREQVFGWAFQGARTAARIAALNDAVNLGQNGYLQDRLDLMGVDDVLMDGLTPDRAALQTALNQAGFTESFKGDAISVLHRDGAPRAVAADWKILGIGSGAINYAYLYPQVITADTQYVDDFSLEQLSQYQKVILAGFRWHDKTKAEALVRAAAQNGVEIYVDLTRTQTDPVARIPNFMGVWGEPLIMPATPIQSAAADGTTIDLAAFGSKSALWYTLIPQGLDVETLTFNYLGQRSVITGYNQVDGHKVWFIGLNLVYQVLTTHDPAAEEVLSNVLGLTPGQVTGYTTFPLQGYTANGRGYTFQLDLPEGQQVLVPVAAFDGTQVLIDGKAVRSGSLENMVTFDCPPGLHQVNIEFVKTAIYTYGIVLSAIGLILFSIIFEIREKATGQ